MAERCVTLTAYEQRLFLRDKFELCLKACIKQGICKTSYDAEIVAERLVQLIEDPTNTKLYRRSAEKFC
jgi:hypothetical protein